MNDPVEMTLANLNGGALLEAATVELRKICDNIADPNFRSDTKRKLSINLTILPDAKGQQAQITYQMKTILPSPEAGKTMAYIAQDPSSRAIGLFEHEQHPPLFPSEKSLLTLNPGIKEA
jgi:hypothetical protein